jgi:hypothetical protein
MYALNPEKEGGGWFSIFTGRQESRLIKTTPSLSLFFSVQFVSDHFGANLI